MKLKTYIIKEDMYITYYDTKYSLVCIGVLRKGDIVYAYTVDTNSYYIYIEDEERNMFANILTNYHFIEQIDILEDEMYKYNVYKIKNRSCNNIIFLSIDGVLQSEKYYEKLQNKEIQTKYNICPDIINNLNNLIKSTNLKIVISSTWRHITTLEDLKTIFTDSGFMYVDSIIGITPTIENSPSDKGQEIQKYIDSNDVEWFIIIDSHNNMGNLTNKLFKVNPKYGLTEQDVNRIKLIYKSRKVK